MRWYSTLGLLSAFVLIAPSVGHAVSFSDCRIEGPTRACEVYCNGSCTAPAHATCDTNSDGWCTICGADSILTSTSDDIVFAEAGTDTIEGGGGADQLYGGADADTINSTYWWTSATCPSSDDYLGSRICAGGGNDTISICGYDHQCISGGAGTDTCSYDNAGDGTDPHEVATVDCETATGDPEDARAAGMLCCDE